MGKVPEAVLVLGIFIGIIIALVGMATDKWPLLWLFTGIIISMTSGVAWGINLAAEQAAEVQACHDKSGHWIEYKEVNICVDDDERILR